MRTFQVLDIIRPFPDVPLCLDERFARVQNELATVGPDEILEKSRRGSVAS
jgi:hypothetical protein